MCCDSWEIWAEKANGEYDGICPDCGTLVIIYPDSSMEAKIGCNYSPESCSTCKAADCDGSC
jgi:hypothetical protein